jgi:hypothetical protein
MAASSVLLGHVNQSTRIYPVIDSYTITVDVTEVGRFWLASELS